MRIANKMALAACALAVAALSAGCSGQPAGQPAAQSTQSTQSTQSSAAASRTPGAPVSCTYTPAGQASKPVSLPSGTNVPTTGEAQVTIHMDAGDVVMNLDRSKTPCAINSFTSLVTQHFFDNTSCHRLVPNFVLQCGDPTGTGTGGPGYTFNDELTGQETYPVGTVAMANSGPNTNGSQFFIVIGSQAATLGPNYDVLGTVTPDSMAVVQSIAQQGVVGNASDGKPAGDATIQSAVLG